MDDASADLEPDAQDAAGHAAPDPTQTDTDRTSTWPPMGQITWPRLPAALDAIMTGPHHPSYGDPRVRPWIDLMTPHPLGPGVLDEGLKLLAAQSQAGPASAGTAQDKVSRFQPQTVNDVNNLYFRVMTPDETGASGIGHLGTVTGALSQLPSSILSNLRDQGVRWIVTQDSADQGFPEANLTAPVADDHPHAWPGGKDIGDMSSMYVNANARPGLRPHTVVIGTENPQGDNSFNVTLHETGHAYDDGKGGLSKSKKFRQAYFKDVPEMTTPNEDPNDNDAYYLPQTTPNDPNRGPREAFAEGFARYYGSDPTLQQDWPAMYRFWQDYETGLRNASRFRK